MNWIDKIFCIAALGGTALLSVGCTEKDQDPVVDLRYDVQDEYSLPAGNPETITFRVRSLYTPWEVTGGESVSWYTVSPSKGAAGETATVTVTVSENTGLDDREDVISIKSDYWTGKQFRLFQKGTAYLTAEDVVLEQEGAKYAIPVSSNQKWSAAVTEGGSWLSITAGATGEKDGKIEISTTTNKGEQRPGRILISDRYDRPTVEVLVTQNGVVLNPIYPEDPDPNEDVVSWIRVYHEEQVLEIPVESNAQWTVEKGDPGFEDWFELEQTSFNGNGTVRVKLTANAGTSVRTGTLVLSTVAEGDVTPVVKNVKFKQGNERVPSVMGTDINVSGSTRLGDAKCGRYDFYVQGATGNDMRFTFYYPSYPFGTNGPRELRYWLNRAGNGTDSSPIMSTMPWVTNPFNPDACINFSNSADPGTFGRIDKNQPHVLTLDISKIKVEGDETTWARISWYIDGELIHNSNKANDGILISNMGNWLMTYDEMNGDPDGYVSGLGNFKVTKWEYTAPIDWGGID